jgi:SEC-C motif
MIFSIEPETQRLVAHVAHDGGVEVYDCTADACGNPVCPCCTTTVVMRPRSPSGATREVGIDLDVREIDEIFRKRASPEILAFADRLLAAMDSADFELMSKLHFALKNQICEEAKPSEIDALFDIEAVERSSALQAYNDVLPFGDAFRVNVGDTDYLALDQYCVKPGCRCTQTHLNLFPIKGEGRSVDSTGAVIVDYAAVSWDPIASEPLPCDVAEYRRIMERSSPDFYKSLRARHKKMRAIYAHCREREIQALRRRRIGAVGRNDPCPCGSGKKYKKCCMGKSAIPASGQADRVRTSKVISVPRVPRSP